MKSIAPALSALACACLCLSSTRADTTEEQAALLKEADKVVTGLVLQVDSKMEEPKPGVERNCVHIDHTLRFRVDHIIKGEGLKVGDEIVVHAWEKLPLKGGPECERQGHLGIPENVKIKDGMDEYKQRRVLFLKANKDGSYTPLLPGGIQKRNMIGNKDAK